MTRQEIAALSCKILALWLFAQVSFFGASIIAIPIFTIDKICDDGILKWRDIAPLAALSVPVVCMLVLGLIFWFKSSKIGSRMVGDDTTPVTRPDITKKGFLSIAIAAIGVFILLTAVRGFTGSIFQVCRSRTFGFSDYWENTDWQADFLNEILGIFLGLIFVLGSRSISRFIMWTRSAGVKYAENNTDDQKDEEQ